MTDLVEKIVQCHTALQAARIPHAFGGALALAWCTEQARGTIDIDLNLLVNGDGIDAALAALPDGVHWEADDRQRLRHDLQHRLWWEATPVDLFFNSSPYHEALAARVRWEAFAGHRLPFLSCVDLAVFKAFFDRTKDWADLEAMCEAGTLDFAHVTATIIELLGADDPRLTRLAALRHSVQARTPAEPHLS